MSSRRCRCREGYTGAACSGFDVDVVPATGAVIAQREVDLGEHDEGVVALTVLTDGRFDADPGIRTVRVVCPAGVNPADVARFALRGDGGAGA